MIEVLQIQIQISEAGRLVSHIPWICETRYPLLSSVETDVGTNLSFESWHQSRRRRLRVLLRDLRAVLPGRRSCSRLFVASADVHCVRGRAPSSRWRSKRRHTAENRHVQHADENVALARLDLRKDVQKGLRNSKRKTTNREDL